MNIKLIFIKQKANYENQRMNDNGILGIRKTKYFLLVVNLIL
jgi:hypothetical protein